MRPTTAILNGATGGEIDSTDVANYPTLPYMGSNQVAGVLYMIRDTSGARCGPAP